MPDQWLMSHQVATMLGGRWMLGVISELSQGGRRYQDLHDALDGISYKVLTETLRRAERDGLIARHLDGRRIETATLYELTDLGRSLDAPLAAMAEWSERNWPAVEAARHHGIGYVGRAAKKTFATFHVGTGSHLRVRRRSLKCRLPCCICGNHWTGGPSVTCRVSVWPGPPGRSASMRQGRHAGPGRRSGGRGCARRLSRRTPAGRARDLDR